MEKQELEKRFAELAEILQDEMNAEGFWTGHLSSSALAVAVAITALHFYDSESNQARIKSGLKWLTNNINADGSFGDSPESPGNVSTSLLVYAAANLFKEDKSAEFLQEKLSEWLNQKGIDVKSPQVSDYILKHYKKDYTFSVPILTMCGLCNVPGEQAFEHVPQLPFELSLLPRKLYRVLNLSVVSYAIPALIAVGIVVFKKKKSNFFWRAIRRLSIRPALNLLQRLMPASGGFLEAIPLTAFVSLSLINAGYKELEVVRNGIQFLMNSQREDGSWAIDIDLSTWVTTLSVKALGSKVNEVLNAQQQKSICTHLLSIQNKKQHPFNGTSPGGWGWTNYSGSVPDGDDTPGTILALLQLDAKIAQQPVMDGCRWLLKLQNRDGGFPTFSKGWGKLPFDQSCADLTGHCLLALSACLNVFGEELDRKDKSTLKASILKAVKFLQKNQNENGSWLPLWFGNQKVQDHSNPVYGTGRILVYLHDTLNHNWINDSIRGKFEFMLDRGEDFLIKAQNDDGSWGGDRLVPGSIEETSIAVSALSKKEYEKAINSGLNWLDDYYKRDGLKASPIGLYFASLWYSEKMYPLTFYLEALVRKLESR